MTHKCSNCRFKDECTEQEKRLTGKGEFCYDFEEANTKCDDDR